MRSTLSVSLLLAGLTLVSACSVSVTHYETRTDDVLFTAKATGDLKPAVSDSTTYSFPDGTANRIFIRLPEENFTAETSTDGNVHISATIFAASPDEVAAYKKSIKTAIDGGDVSISATNSVYMCYQSSVTRNGEVKRWVKGTCVSDVRIALPRNGRTQIFYNGVPAVGMDRLPTASLPAILSAQSSDSRRDAILERFLAARERMYTIHEVARVLATYSSSFSMKDAVDKFRGRISDPQNLAEVLALISSDSSKVDAAKSIISGASGRFIAMAQVLAAVDAISSSFSQKDLCDELSGHVIDPQNAVQVLDHISSSFSAKDAALALSR